MKDSKSEAQYTAHAMKPSERCGVCKYFHRFKGDRGDCDRVIGTVAAAGWCKHFKKLELAAV